MLFHHDPSHHDDRVDELLAEARSIAEHRGVPEVIAAHEGLTISLASTPVVAATSQSARAATPTGSPGGAGHDAAADTAADVIADVAATGDDRAASSPISSAR